MLTCYSNVISYEIYICCLQIQLEMQCSNHHGIQVALSLLFDSRKGRTDINEHSQVYMYCRSSGTAPVDLATTGQI